MNRSNVDYIDPTSIAVVTPGGQMRRLYVPFRVKVAYPTKTLVVNTNVMVEEVRQHPEFRLIYRVGSLWWPYDVFHIQIRYYPPSRT